MRGQHAAVRKLLAAFAGGGHVLIEDAPGTGKTTLAKVLAASVGAKFTRVQFTPDLLPADILGVSIYNQRESRFEFRPGPVFTSILLADEVNRAAPQVLLGCGPRASIALVQSAKALALIDGADFVTPEAVQELAVATLAHRIVLDPQAKFAGASGATLVADILRETKVPA